MKIRFDWFGYIERFKTPTRQTKCVLVCAEVARNHSLGYERGCIYSVLSHLMHSQPLILYSIDLVLVSSYNL